jgi:hypothetical protein
MEKPNRAPDWRIWKHLSKVRLHEAVALSLNIDPKRLDWTPDPFSGRRRFNEGREFDNRMWLAVRCLGDTLPSPENGWAVHWDDADPTVRLKDFAAWAVSVGWALPAELGGLAAVTQSAVASLEAAAQAAGARGSKSDPEPIPNRRGRPAVKMNEAVAAMLDAVTNGKVLISALRRMKQKELDVFNKNAKRTLLPDARVEALEQLSQQGYSDKDPT